MPLVRIAPPGQALLAARFQGGADGSYGPHPTFVRPGIAKASGPFEALALDADGGSRPGKPADVKADLHWVLAPVSGGGYELRPVHGWYEFGQRTTPSGQSVKPVIVKKAPPPKATQRASAKSTANSENDGEVKLRKELANRWEGMLERRDGRVGVAPVKRGQLFKEVLRPPEDPVEEKDAAKYSATENAGQAKRLPAFEERMNDDMGLKRQKEKNQKRLRKERQAVDEAEEGEVADTANSLHHLKTETGESGWDFSDKEASDDDEEKVQFGDHQLADAEEVEAPPSGDEDEGEDAEDGDLSTKHGRSIEALLREQQEEGASSPQRDDEAEKPVEKPRERSRSRDAIRSYIGLIEEVAREPSAASKQNVRERVVKESPAVEQAVEASSNVAAATASDAVPRITVQTEAVASPPTMVVRAPPARAAQAVAPARPIAGAEDRSRMRLQIIEYLKKKGGKCRAMEVMTAMGFVDKTGTPAHKEFVKVLKEVTTLEKPNVVLKEKYV